MNATAAAAVHYPSFVNSTDLPANFGFILPSNVEADKLSEQLPTSAWWAITPQKLFVSDRTGNWSEMPLKDLSDIDQPFSLTKSSLPTFIPTWQKMIDYTVIVGAVLYPFGWLVLGILIRVFTLLFDCLVIYFFLKMLDRELPFTKLVQIALHIAVIAEIVNLFARYAFPTSTAPMFMVTFWAYMIFVLSTLWNVRKVDPKNLPPSQE
jgi:hypothetical protein